MASNRFAALAPDFAEEEAKRKAVADFKAKKDAAKVKQEEQAKFQEKKGGFEGAEGQVRGTAERGRGRGVGRPYRGRGGYSRGGAGAVGGQYVPKDRRIPKERSDFHYEGSNDTVHPFDRKSGTGRGTEVPKQGAGARNWGRPEDDIKNQEEFEGEIEHAPQKLAVLPEGEAGKPVELAEKDVEEDKRMSKKERKMRKKDVKKEEKKEEVLDADGTALTYEQYKQKFAESQKDLPAKKAELKAVRDPKIAGLVAYDKPQLARISQVAIKAEKKEGETKAEPAATEETDVLGSYIDREYTRRGTRRGGRWKEEAPRAEEKTEAPVQEEAKLVEGAEKPQRGRGAYRGQRRGGYGYNQPETYDKAEEKKPTSTAFVMKDDDFPVLK